MFFCIFFTILCSAAARIRFTPTDRPLVQGGIAPGASSVHLVDVNNDGLLDIAYTARTQGILGFFQNNGNASFSAGRTVTVLARGAEEVRSADLDGDGLVDLVSVSSVDNKVAWYRNEGNSTFGLQRVLWGRTGTGPSSVDVGDLDGDDRPDIVTAMAGDGALAWFHNEGNGTFGSATRLSSATAGASCVRLADLDDDGHLDVVASSRGDSTVGWFANNGSGSFGARVVLQDSLTGAASVATGDIDGDGRLDVAAVGELAGRLGWFRHSETGTSFGDEVTFPTGLQGPVDVQLADVDGDGDVDWLVAEKSGHRVRLVRGAGDGAFGSPVVTVSTAPVAPESLAIGDIDGDGHLDLAVASSVDGTIAWHRNLGGSAPTNGSPFAPRVRLTTVAAGAGALAAGDLDGDGDLDVVVGAADDNSVAWLENDGTGQSAGRHLISDEVTSVSSVVCTDVDGDGDLDVLAASSATINGGVSLFLNDGEGVFSAAATPGGAAAASSGSRVNVVLAVDISGDGKSDLLATGLDDAALAWLAGRGDGTYGSWTTILDSATTDAPACVATADVDNDGIVDLLTATPGADQLAWHRGTGGGSFGTPQVISSTAAGAEALVAADVDGDGDVDVVAAASIDGAVVWHANLGGGTFAGTPTVISDAQPSVAALAAADLDGDGDVDLVSAASGVSVVPWFENDGSGSFTLHTVATGIGQPAAVLVGDFGGKNGHPDVVVAGLEGHVGVYVNSDVSPDGTPAPPPAATDDGDSSMPGSEVDDGSAAAPQRGVCLITLAALTALGAP